jgi:flagellar hook protein FlgE
MSIFSAMQSGVSGLFANATKVSKISDNIANSNTVGYKRTFADFVTTRAATDVISSNTSAPSSVKSVIKTNINTQGNILTTGVDTDLSVTGNGFFAVGRNPNEIDPSGFSLTRAGSFRPDEDGNLVNSAGKYLYGFKFDNQGNLGVLDRTSFNSLQSVNIKEVEMIGNGTTFMTFNGNLPAQETGPATTGTPFQSSAEYFSPLGTSDRLIFNWTPTATPNQWTLSVDDNAGNNFGSVDVTFNDSGASAGSPQSWSNIVNSSTAPANFTFDPATGQATITIDNGTTPQVLEVNLGAPGDFTGITQFAGDYTTQQIDKDGAAAGKLSSVEINDDGIVYGVFNNGARKALYQVPLATLTNPNGLSPADGNTFRVTQEAGSFRLVDSNSGFAGNINSGTLERSNVDIAEELTSLIETQRAYSSNAKIITTSDEMLEETTRIKR